MIQARIEQLHTDYGKFALWGACGVIMSLLFTYSYFLNASVWNVVERKNAEKEISIVGSRVALLEAEYFSETDNLTLATAKSLGFFESKETRFAVRGGEVQNTLTVNR